MCSTYAGQNGSMTCNFAHSTLDTAMHACHASVVSCRKTRCKTTPALTQKYIIWKVQNTMSHENSCGKSVNLLCNIVVMFALWISNIQGKQLASLLASLVARVFCKHIELVQSPASGKERTRLALSSCSHRVRFVMYKKLQVCQNEDKQCISDDGNEVKMAVTK